MITFETARIIAINKIKSWNISGDEFVLLEDKTIEKTFGWVFFYTSKLWFETNEMKYAIAGNSPLFISRTSGEIKSYPTHLTLEQMIEEHVKR